MWTQNAARSLSLSLSRNPLICFPSGCYDTLHLSNKYYINLCQHREVIFHKIYLFHFHPTFKRPIARRVAIAGLWFNQFPLSSRTGRGKSKESCFFIADSSVCDAAIITLQNMTSIRICSKGLSEAREKELFFWDRVDCTYFLSLLAAVITPADVINLEAKMTIWDLLTKVLAVVLGLWLPGEFLLSPEL